LLSCRILAFSTFLPVHEIFRQCKLSRFDICQRQHGDPNRFPYFSLIPPPISAVVLTLGGHEAYCFCASLLFLKAYAMLVIPASIYGCLIWTRQRALGMRSISLFNVVFLCLVSIFSLCMGAHDVCIMDSVDSNLFHVLLCVDLYAYFL
jgi:hypothetical protein